MANSIFEFRNPTLNLHNHIHTCTHTYVCNHVSSPSLRQPGLIKASLLCSRVSDYLLARWFFFLFYLRLANYRRCFPVISNNGCQKLLPVLYCQRYIHVQSRKYSLPSCSSTHVGNGSSYIKTSAVANTTTQLRTMVDVSLPAGTRTMRLWFVEYG